MQAQPTAGPELRPLSIGEILDVAIKIYFRHALTLFRIVLIVVAPVQILVALIQTSSALEDDATVSGTEIAVVVTGVLLVVVLTIVASTVATGACFKAVADAYLEENPTWRSSLAFAFRRFHSILWVTILAGLAAIVGAIACVVPGIYLWVLFAVAVPVLLTEGIRGSAALGRSRALVQGRWWPTFGVVIVGYLLASLVSFFVGLTAGASIAAGVDEASLAAFLVNAIGGTLGSVLSTPFTAAFTTVLYFDLRVRKEGFDLQLLAERIGLAPRPEGYRVAPPPGPAPAFGASGEAPPYWPPPPGWQPSGGAPSFGSPGLEGPPPPGAADAPPYWPPPPGWQPSGAPPTGPPGAPGPPPPGAEDAPPYWPPPPGWRPPSERDDS